MSLENVLDFEDVSFSMKEFGWSSAIRDIVLAVAKAMSEAMIFGR